MKETPKALFIIDPRAEHIAVREAIARNVPIIALASSDCDIAKITYPIVANDSAAQSIRFFVGEAVTAYKEGTDNQQLTTDNGNSGTVKAGEAT